MKPFTIEGENSQLGFSQSGVSDVHVGGIPLDALNEARLLYPTTTTGQRTNSEGRFWSSRPRFNSDRTREAFEVELVAERLVNYVELELARFPHKAFFQYYDSTSNKWLDLLDRASGNPIRNTISDSLPARINSLTDAPSGSHSQHFGAGHWVLTRLEFRAIRSTRFRVVLVRSPGTPPVKIDGSEIAYSLGVKNFVLGFAATEIDLVPHGDFINTTERTPFGETIDPLRSPVTYSLRENQAQTLVDATGVWKSEPQPVRNAVVNLYVDARDPLGNPQIVDRFYVKPIYSGPKVNLYYATEKKIAATKPAFDNPISTNFIRASSSVSVNPAEGLSFATRGNFTISNQAVRLDTSEPFWIALSVSPNFSSTDTAKRVILDVGRSNRGQNFNQDAQELLDNGSISGYTTLTTSTIAFNPSVTDDGSNTVEVTTIDAATGAVGFLTAPKEVRGGDDITVSARFQAATTGRGVVVGFLFLNASGTQIGDLQFGTPRVDSTIGFTEATASMIAPPQATAYQVVCLVQGSVLGEQHYVSRVSSYRTGFSPESILSMVWEGQTWKVTYNGTTLALPQRTFDWGLTQDFVISFDGESITLKADTGDTNTINVQANPRQSDSIRFGDYLRGSLYVGGFRLAALSIKGGPGTEDDHQEFFGSPQAYVTKADFRYQEDHSTDGAILRFSPQFSRFDNFGGITQWGFLGGPLNDYEGTFWIPINQDFDLHQGEWSFPPVRALFFKFEFSDLAPQPFDMQEPVVRTVQVFPFNDADPVRPNRTSFSPAESSKGGSGVTVSQEISGIASFADSEEINRNPSAPTAYTQTQVLYAEDPELAAQIRTSGGLDYMRVASSSRRSRFEEPQVHTYRKVEILHDRKIAFYAGISSLRMSRTDFRASDNTAEYVELFDDNTHFQSTVGYPPMAFVPQQGLTNERNGSVAAMQSVVMSSKSNVIGVQFATQQSDAYQLLSDPDFTDSNLGLWSSYGDSTIDFSSDRSSTLGTTIKVTRRREGTYWDNMEVFFPTWSSLENQIWSELEDLQPSSYSYGGVACKEFVNTTEIGRVHAAVRVYAPKQLTAPLSIQIVDGGGNVLAEEVRDISAGEVAEWYASYTIGDTIPTFYSWDDVAGLYPTWTAIEGKPWDDLESAEGYRSGNISVILVQKNPTTDVFYVDNISIFDDPIVWEFTNNGGTNWYKAQDIRNNPRGVLVFPTAGSKLAWRVKSARYQTNIGSVAVRPWYNEAVRGVPNREGIEVSGANRSRHDLVPPILSDARFKAWGGPIPESWYFVRRQWLLRQKSASSIV